MRYAKFLLAVVVTILVSIISATVGNHVMTPTEWVNVAISGVSACMVFAAPNVPGALYTKTIIAVLMAVLSFLATVIVPCQSFLGCHVATRDILQMVVIAAGALGVFAVPNSPAEARSAG